MKYLLMYKKITRKLLGSFGKVLSDLLGKNRIKLLVAIQLHRSCCLKQILMQPIFSTVFDNFVHVRRPLQTLVNCWTI